MKYEDPCLPSLPFPHTFVTGLNYSVQSLFQYFHHLTSERGGWGFGDWYKPVTFTTLVPKSKMFDRMSCSVVIPTTCNDTNIRTFNLISSTKFRYHSLVTTCRWTRLPVWWFFRSSQESLFTSSTLRRKVEKDKNQI